VTIITVTVGIASAAVAAMFLAAGTIAIGYVYGDRINITCQESK